MQDDGNNFVWRQKPSRQFTASHARDQTVLSQHVCKDKAYSFMKNIRVPLHITSVGTPPWFFTLSAADLKWPDMIKTIARQYGGHYTDEQVAALSFKEKSNWLKRNPVKEKSNWLKRNPVTAARHFHYRLKKCIFSLKVF